MNNDIGKNPDYNYIIRRAFQLTWKYKFLWLFGIFLNFGANLNLRSYNLSSLPSSLNRPKFRDTVSSWVLTHIWLLLVIGLLLFLVWLLFFIANVISQAAVVKTVDEVENDNKPTFTAMLRFGASKFWRVLGLILLI
ncbi:MAG TPA: hypothetical protein ENH19_01655, partial [Actinobacteria bacterium]|nr:hypothetical protein [Actinomycetes bacterium]HEX21343.1 hypothetical protein [Actinomycetota bacterium]